MLDDGPPTGRDAESDLPEEEEVLSDNSLADDIGALIDDGKTYAEAEIAFQKSRLSFAANRGKTGALSALFALAVLHLALVALVLGSILALTPLFTAWGATAMVVGILLLAGMVAGLVAKNRFVSLGKAFDSAKSDEDTHS